MPAVPTRTLPKFNDGHPLRVVRVDSERLGVVDESTRRVWIEHDVVSTRVDGPLHTVELPHIPDEYGKWINKWVGGVSSTVRRIGVIRGKPHHTDPVVLFAIRCTDVPRMTDALSQIPGVTVGDVESTEEHGNVVETVVHSIDDVAHVASIIAREGGVPVLEDDALDAQRSIGIERLDRIHADVVHDRSIEEGDDVTGGLYGLRRGGENWRFPWMPDEWKRVPITWDHLVDNVIDKHDIAQLPQPLRQHVARVVLNRDADKLRNDFSKWTKTSPPAREELEGRGYRLVVDGDFSTHLRGDRVDLQCNVEFSDVSDPRIAERRIIARGSNGEWYRPVDTTANIARHIPSKRLVSSALERKQSIQLIEAFYALSVERIVDDEMVHALELVMYRYMFERGYTARWLGKYEQQALHVGNGVKFRSFRRLSQYAPERLPPTVLNRLCGRDGCVKARGSKGTRSRFKREGVKRYVPARRLTRTLDDESSMIDVS